MTKQALRQLENLVGPAAMKDALGVFLGEAAARQITEETPGLLAGWHQQNDDPHPAEGPDTGEESLRGSSREPVRRRRGKYRQ